MNGSSWTTAKAQIEALGHEVHLVFVQEAKLWEEEIPAAQSWAGFRGWKAVIAPAVPGPAGGRSGGVAVLARDWLGMHPVPLAKGREEPVFAEGRCIAVEVHFP